MSWRLDLLCWLSGSPELFLEVLSYDVILWARLLPIGLKSASPPQKPERDQSEALVSP